MRFLKKYSNLQYLIYCSLWVCHNLFLFPPPPSPHPQKRPWYSPHLRLLEGQKGLKVENKAFFSRLTFFNVSEQDYGNYTCVAYNQLGNTNASIILYGKCGLSFHGLAIGL